MVRLKVGQTLQFRLSQVFTTREGKSREIGFSDEMTNFFWLFLKERWVTPPWEPPNLPLPHSPPPAPRDEVGAPTCFVFFNKVRNPMDTQNKTALRKKNKPKINQKKKNQVP